MEAGSRIPLLHALVIGFGAIAALLFGRCVDRALEGNSNCFRLSALDEDTHAADCLEATEPNHQPKTTNN